MARRVEVHLVGDSRSLERAFDRAENRGRQFDRTMSSRLKTWGKAGAVGAAVAGTALLTKGLSDSIKAAKDAQVAEANLRQALRASGKSYKQYGKQIDATLQKTSKLSAFDDEELSDSFAKIVRSTGNVQKSMKGMALAADIARARNVSLETATKAVERALNGNESAFSRLGIQSNKNKDATDELEKAYKKFGGSAAAFGKTATGAQLRFGVAVENLQEKIGQKLLPVLTRLTLRAIDFIDWVDKNWPKFQRRVEEMWTRVKPVFDAFKGYLEGWVKIIKGIIEGDWSLVWSGLKQAVANGFKLVFEYLKAVPLRFFQFGLRMGQELARGVLAGLASLPQQIGKALLPTGKQGPGPASSGGRFPPKTTPKSPAATAPPKTELYGGPRARGGSVAPGRAYMVGEQGPEWFSPAQAGTISASGGAGIHIGTILLPNVQNAQDFLVELQRMARSTNASRRGPMAGTKFATT